MRKNILMLAGVLVAFFGLNRASTIVNGSRHDSGSAWASGWNGIDDDGADNDSAATAQPDTAPPDIAGTWSGTIVDSIEGTGSFDLFIDQKSGKIAGEWEVSFGGSGDFKGSVKGNGKISIDLETPEDKHRGCHASAKGTVTDDDNISVTFKFAGCGPHSGDEFGTINLNPI